MNFLVTVNNQSRVPCQPVKAKDPWAAAIEVIQARSERKGISPREFEAALQLVELQFCAAGHILYKRRWSSRHRIPYSKPFIEGANHLASELHALCNLAIEVHAVRSGPEYPAALDWLEAVVKERKASYLEGLLTPATNTQGKKQLQQWARQLQDGGNPFCTQTEPHTHRLIERALKQAVGAKRGNLFSKLLTGAQVIDGVKVLGLAPALKSAAEALNTGKTEVLYLDPKTRNFLISTERRLPPKIGLKFPLGVE